MRLQQEWGLNLSSSHDQPELLSSGGCLFVPSESLAIIRQAAFIAKQKVLEDDEPDMEVGNNQLFPEDGLMFTRSVHWEDWAPLANAGSGEGEGEGQGEGWIV